MAESPTIRSRFRCVAIDLSVSISSGLLLWVALAPIGQFYLAWIALVPLLWRIQTLERTRHAALLGCLAGLTFFLAGFHWLFNATRGGYFVCCLILSLYWMLAAVSMHRLRRSGPTAYVFAAALIWTATEYLRGIVLGGFPWLNIGHTQTPILAMCQVADIAGVAGVTAWVVLVNAALLRILLDRRSALRAGAVVLSITIVALAYGLYRISEREPVESTIRIALVQPNHVHTPDGERTVTQQQQIDYHLARSRSIDADLIVWSETTMPGLNVEARTEPGLRAGPFLNQTFDQLAALVRDRSATLVTGGYFVGGWKGEIGKRSATDIRNSVYVLSPTGELIGRYDKIRLVPFAEYVPFQESKSWLHAVMTRFATASYAAGYRLTPSTDRTVFEVRARDSRIRAVTPICFEDTVAPLVRSFFAPDNGSKEKRADLILNISNDGWFNGAEKALHLQIAVFRSIENRVPTARVSNTGQSAFIDSTGRVTGKLDSFSEGILTGSPMLDRRISVYTRIGEAFGWVCIVSASVFVGSTFIRRNGRAAMA